MSSGIAKAVIGAGVSAGIAGGVIVIELIRGDLGPEALWIAISGAALVAGYLLFWWGGRSLRSP